MVEKELNQSELEISQQIICIAQRLHSRNMLAAADGNISYKLDDQRILITPSGFSKAFISPDQMAIVRLDGEVLKGHPSSERLMHLEVYRQCPIARCVVHAHPPTAIAWSIARPDLKELPNNSMSEVILATGRIPVIPYARPGEKQMGENLVPELAKGQRVMILSRHGALSWGEDLEEAYGGMERIEHSAQILKLAVDLGGITPLPEEEVKALLQIRRRLGERTL